MTLTGFPAEVVRTVEDLAPGRVLTLRGTGPTAVTVTTRYTLTPDGEGTSARIDGEFTGAAVSLVAGKPKDSATAALHESLRRLTAPVS